MDTKKDNALKGDEVVISGMSGIFPKSDSMLKFMENLYNKVDMVSSDNPRWTVNHPEMPKHLGMIDGMEKFDAQFFKIHSKLAYTMEPMARKLFEHSHGAIYDAGFSPKELQGKRIGIFLALGPNEYEKFIIYNDSYTDMFALPGSFKAMFPNRISYWIDSKSPSYALESGLSFIACMDHAYRAINSGNIEAAIIGSSNFCTQPGLTLNLSKAGVLCLDGKTKCFDQSGDGYVRADSVNSFFLQKAKDARRIYSEIYHTKCTYHTKTEKYLPKRETKFIEQFLKEFYSEIYMNPSDVEYIEASASGIAEYDGNELKAVGEIFSKESPTKIGSVKSNMGSAEAASEGCAIAKMCLAYHKGEIPANLHYNQPQNHILSVRDGKVQVLTENTSFSRGFTACNGFTELGINSHILLKGHFKPKDLTQYKTDIPRLIFASGRLESCVNNIFEKLKSQNVDPELIGLLHSIHSNDISGHTQRGHIIIDSKNQTKCLRQNVSHFTGEKPQLWFIYSGMGSQWVGMGRELMRIPAFAAAIQRCQDVLLPKGVDIIKIITEPDQTIFENSLNSFVGITAVQIGLTDLLKDVGIVPDYILGHSLGELVCAYADGCLTAEQTILISYVRGKIAVEMKFIRGSMVAVGLGYKDVLPLCPPEIVVACHNSSVSSTLSGPAEIMADFVVKLNSLGIFAKEVPCGNVPYHSKYISSAESVMITATKEIIKEPKLRSPKWISSSMPQKKWKEPLARYNSPEYHCFNLLNPVLFEEASSLIPPNAILLEVAPHSLFQSILKKSHKDCHYVPLTRRLVNGKENEIICIFLNAMGKLYELGLNPKVDVLYPKIKYPVSTETPLLSHFVEWNHTEDWPQPVYEIHETVTTLDRDQIISKYDDDHKYLKGYIRNGVNIVPEAVFLVFVWETLAMYNNVTCHEMSVIFDDVYFHNEIIINDEDLQTLNVMILKCSGSFEISYKNMIIASGIITAEKENFDCQIVHLKSDDEINFNRNDINKLMKYKGYSYSEDFQNIYELKMQHGEANIKWTGNWVTFLDSLLHINMLLENYDGVSTPKYILKLSINVNNHKSEDVVLVNGEPCYKAEFSQIQKICRCGGVEVKNILYDSKPAIEEVPNMIEARTFIPHILLGHINFETALHINLQTLQDNIMKNKIHIIELFSDPASSISDIVRLIASVSPKNRFDIFPYKIQNSHSEFLDVIGKSDVIIVHDLLGDQYKINELHAMLLEDTFVLAIEDDTSEIYPLNYNLFTIITTISAKEQTLILLKKASSEKIRNVIYINVTHDEEFSWILNVVKELESDKRVTLVSQNQPLCGLFGFAKKLREQFGNRISLVIIDDDKAPEFNVEKNVYKRQLEKNLAFNIFEKGRWGSYYYIPREQHLSFQNIRLIRTSPKMEGLKWVEAPKTSVNETVKVCYASLSYKDAERAIGDVNDSDDNVFGMDFSGINDRGERVMGAISRGAVSSTVEADPELTWPVPEYWDLEEAATVPLPYLHAYYCLMIKGHLKRGKKVLLTGGAGALGQAIISICLDLDCTVFTTVSNLRKKELLLRLFPKLDESNVLPNCRHESLYEIMRRKTNNLGCDLVINSDVGAIREAACKCIIKYGRFLDLGIFNRDGNRDLLFRYINRRSYVTVNVSSILKYNITKDKKELHRLVAEGIMKGVVKPLVRVVYPPEEVHKALRLLTTRRNVGRVVINMNDLSLQVTPRLTISPEVTYIIVCGESELGIELIDRLIKRGVRKLVIQHDNIDGYFNMKLMQWKKIGITIKLAHENLQTKEGCEKILNEGNSCNKIIEGVIVVSNCDKLKNYEISQQNMKEKFNDLALVVANLDNTTRAICHNLRYFVVLTNKSPNLQDQYAFSASEKICHARNLVGLPALYLCAEIINEDLVTQNTKANIKTCLNSLETSLRLKYNNIHLFKLRKNNIDAADEITKILGITDLAALPDNLNLNDLNVSRLYVQEIKSLMKDTHQVSQCDDHIKEMTISNIKNMKSRQDNEYHTDAEEIRLKSGLGTFFNYVGNYESKSEPLVSMNTRLGSAVEAESVDATGSYLMVLPGFDGNHKVFANLCEQLKIKAVILQLEPDMANSSIQDMAQNMFKFIKKRFELKSVFYLLGYSFGVNVALQLAALLEKEGHVGIIFCLDSSPDALRVQLDAHIGKISIPQLQNAIIQHMYKLMTGEECKELNDELENLVDWSEKVRITINSLKLKITYSHEYVRYNIIESAYRKILLAQKYDPDFELVSQLVLLKGIPHPEAVRLTDDYNLSKYTKQPVKVFDIQSDHISAPKDLTVANYVNRNLNSKLLEEFNQMNLCQRYVFTKQCY